MADGFRVDLKALLDAAEGVVGTVEAIDAQKVSDIDCAESAFGHDQLGGTVSDFCDRWQIGVGHLAKDGQEVAGRLVHSAQGYAMRDVGNRDRMDRILQGSGPDPGAD